MSIDRDEVEAAFRKYWQLGAVGERWDTWCDECFTEDVTYIEHGATLLEKLPKPFLDGGRLELPGDRPLPPGQKQGRVPPEGRRRIGGVRKDRQKQRDLARFEDIDDGKGGRNLLN